MLIMQLFKMEKVEISILFDTVQVCTYPCELYTDIMHLNIKESSNPMIPRNINGVKTCNNVACFSMWD